MFIAMPRLVARVPMESSMASTSTLTGTARRAVNSNVLLPASPAQVGDGAHSQDADIQIAETSRNLVDDSRRVVTGDAKVYLNSLRGAGGFLDLLCRDVQPLITQYQQVGEELVDPVVADLHHHDASKRASYLGQLAALPVAVVKPNNVSQRGDDARSVAPDDGQYKLSHPVTMTRRWRRQTIVGGQTASDVGRRSQLRVGHVRSVPDPSDLEVGFAERLGRQRNADRLRWRRRESRVVAMPRMRRWRRRWRG